jgi:hypothetical protein
MKSIAKKLSAALFLAIVFALLLTQSANTCLAELTAPREETLTFLRDVVGLNMPEYNAKLVNILGEPSAQQSVKYTLESVGSKLDAVCTFENSVLVGCTLYPFEGAPIFCQLAANVLDEAKMLLSRYQTYSKASYLQSMSDMLNTVTEIETKSTTSNNVKFTITIEEDYVTIQWMKTVSGVDNDYTRIILRFHNGTFEQFWDSWNLYELGVTAVKVSKEDAIRIARETARNYSYEVGNVTVSNFTILDSPVSAELSMQPRENNTLYPWWNIFLYLDKLYPGNVNSIQVTFWGDTGEVTHISPISHMGAPPTENPTEPPTEPSIPYELIYGMALPIFGIVICFGLLVYFKKRKR